MRLVKTITFDAAHYLHVDSDKRPYARLHGHSFVLEVAIEGEPDPATGWVADFADITEGLEEVRELLDHRLLNEVEGLGKPTLENLCRFVAARLKPKYPGLAQVKVSRPTIGEACIYDVVE